MPMPSPRRSNCDVEPRRSNYDDDEEELKREYQDNKLNERRKRQENHHLSRFASFTLCMPRKQIVSEPIEPHMEQPIVTNSKTKQRPIDAEFGVSIEQPMVKKNQPSIVKKELPTSYDDDDCEISCEISKLALQLRDIYLNKLKQDVSRTLAKFGVPMPSGMVLSKSTRYMIPILKELVVEEREIITTHQGYISKKALISLIMMFVVVFVILGVYNFNLNYASLGYGLWFWCIYSLCTLTYLVWLREKEKSLEKYRAEIAEWVLEERKKLPMVEVDNVKADQGATDVINLLCCQATRSLYLAIPTFIQYVGIASMSGIFVLYSLYTT